MVERFVIDRLGQHGDAIAEGSDGPIYIAGALPGETVEVGFLVTELVLVVNRLVGEVRDLKATIYGLQNPPIKDEPFKLPSVAGEYE